jgi:hypothetical protein
MAKKSRAENCGPAKIVVLWETLTNAPRKSSSLPLWVWRCGAPNVILRKTANFAGFSIQVWRIWPQHTPMTEAHFDFPKAKITPTKIKRAPVPGLDGARNIFMTRRNILLEVCAGSSAE